MAAAFRHGAARLAIVGDDPNLLAGQDADLIARANRARAKAYRPALELITASPINWSLVPSPPISFNLKPRAAGWAGRTGSI
jgi:aminopeptidase